MFKPDCPADDTLSAFSEGRIDDELLDEVATHVLDCSDCQQTLESLVAHPVAPLLARVTRYTTTHEEPVEGHRCREAIARAASLSTVGGGMNSDTREFGSDTVNAEPPQFIGHYRILGLVGKGGMGTVYRALHTGLDKVVAIKLLPIQHRERESAVQRFKWEMKAVGKVQHPNIVNALDAGEAEGVHYLVMEFVPGLNLLQLLDQHGPLSVPAACELIRQAALGLEHAWKRGLVHRDIKPSNLMLSVDDAGRPLVKILDLGLALSNDLLPMVPDADSGDDLTSCGQIMGTLDYIAPEQARDSHTVDVRADVYSLGATLYKLLTNAAPVSRESMVKGKSATEQNESAPAYGTRLPHIPGGLTEIIDRMLSAQPADRPASPGEVAQMLAPFASEANLVQLLPAELIPERPLRHSAPEIQVLQEQGSRTSHADRSSAHLMQKSHALTRWLLASGVTLLAGFLLWQTFYIQTRHGTVVVEVNDPQLKVTIGAQDFSVDRNGQKVEFAPGEHALRIRVGELQFESDKFTLLNGKMEAFKVRLVPGEVQVVRGNRAFGQWKVSPLHSPPAEHPPQGDPQRELAEWVVRHRSTFGCRIKSNAVNYWYVESLDQIPVEPFNILTVHLNPQSPEVVRQFVDLTVDRVPLRDFTMTVDAEPGKVVADSLRQIARLTSLESVNLRGAGGLVPADFKVLSKLPRLSVLNFEAMPFGDELLRQLPLFPQVGVLYFNDCAVTDQGLEPLRNSRIRNLYLNSTVLTDHACEIFAEMPELRDLRVLSCQGFTGVSFARMAKVPLEKLSLEHTGITDDSLRFLRTFPQLKILELRHNSLTDVGMGHLTALSQQHLKLETLVLEEERVTSEALQHFLRAFPDCQVTSKLLPGKIDLP